MPPGLLRHAGPKRLRRVHRLMNAYGEPWQHSVVCCTLRVTDRVRLETALREAINLKEDQVLLVDLGGRRGGSAGVVELPRCRDAGAEERRCDNMTPSAALCLLEVLP